MALTEKREIKFCGLEGPYFNVAVKAITIILRDGVEIARTVPHRLVLTPDTDLTVKQVLAPGVDAENLPAEVKAIASAVWTDEVKTAYEEWKAANAPAEE